MPAADPRNILVIHFGQLGDVVLGLPALDAIRGRFPEARLTAMTGTPADQVVELSGLANRTIGVNRRALKYGSKVGAIREIVRLARRLRRERFDAVVDLHAFYETGLLARFTGARTRVGPRRENRSLPFVYTTLAPPEDLTAHMSDRYLAVARAAGALPRATAPHIDPGREARDAAGRVLRERFPVEGRIVGLNPGAGWEIRRWPADRFVELGRRLASSGNVVAVFAGPEEPGLGSSIADGIGGAARAIEGLSLAELAATMARCAIVVSNDTGPSHISAAAGTPTLVLMPGNAGPSACAIRGEHHRLVHGESIRSIGVDDVFAVALEMLAQTAFGEQ